jgi:hypothetical protein
VSSDRPDHNADEEFWRDFLTRGHGKVNATARLASTAAAGEVLVTVAAAQAAGLDPTLER